MTSLHHTAAASQCGSIHRRWIQIAALGAGVALLWTALAGWALPQLLKPRIEAAASEALGTPFSIERLDIAPWSLQAVVGGLRLGPAEAPWLQVAEIVVDVSAESLWQLAPVVERLRVSRPLIELERIEAGRFNISPMLDALSRPSPAPEGGEPARFALHNLKIEGARIHLVDRVGGSEHRIEALQLGIPFVSNLPSGVAVDVEPLLEAQVNGSPLALHGRTLPFSEGRRSSIDIDWRQIDVPAWLGALLPLLPQPLPVAVKEGRLDLALRIDFERRTAPLPPSLHITGGITLAGFRAALPAQGATLAFEKLGLSDLDLRPLERLARIGRVELQSPAAEIDLSRLPSGSPSQPAPAKRPPDASAAPPAGPPSGWQWAVDAVQLAEGRVALRHPAWPQEQVIRLAAVDLKGLDSRADAVPATLAVRAADERGASLRVEGSLTLAPGQLTLKTELAGFRPVSWLAPWQSSLPVRLLDATVAAQAQAESGPGGWALRDAALQLTGLRLQPLLSAKAEGASTAKGTRKAGEQTPPAPMVVADDQLSLPRLAVSGVQLRADAGQALVAQVASVRIDGLALRAARSEQGLLAWMPAAVEGGSASPAPGSNSNNSSSTRPDRLPAPPPRWQLGELRCNGCSLTLTDRGVSPAAVHALIRTDLKLRTLSSDPRQPIGFELNTAAGVAGKGGKLMLRGDVRAQPLALKSRIEIDAFDLSGLQPYLDPLVNLTLTSAKLSAGGDLRVDGDAQQAVSALGWKGRAALAELRALDKLNDAELLRFKRLGLDSMDLQWTPQGLQADLGHIALEDFYSRVIVNADGRINLRDIARRGGEDRSLTTPTPAPAAAPAVPSPTATNAAQTAPEPRASGAPAVAAAAAVGDGGTAANPSSSSALPQLRWSSIRLAGGGVDFTDNFIQPNYSARLTDIAGEVSALAWNDPQPAKVQISGKVDGSAPLEIGGTVHPLGARLDTDITASARGVDITRLTAYAARYAGYGIEKGTLSVKVRYKIANGKLEAENNLYLDQLTFGAAVDSPNALKLPLQLAVALLRDRHGVIDINLPISGSLDDPQFSLGGVIVKVIVNLITKAITAPFALLGNLFGGGGEELGYVEFEAGSNLLTETATRRLDALGKALLDRPALKLEATGRADGARDEAALRAQHLDRLMRAAKAKSSGDLPGSVKIEPGERDRWLEAAYKAADLKDKPRNLVGLAKSLPPAEMEARLLAAAPGGDEELRTLANQRGDRVKAYLVTKVPPERVLLTASKLGAEGIEDQGLTTRVAFSLK